MAKVTSKLQVTIPKAIAEWFGIKPGMSRYDRRYAVKQRIATNLLREGLWAYAECYGLNTILSEDLQPGRLYGSVRIVNPFSMESRPLS